VLDLGVLARNERFVEMFLDEARIAAQIHHANVCSVLDFDVHHGTYFLAMELLSGQTLTAIQRQLHDPTRDAEPGVFARILESACEGLHAAHEATDSHGVSLHIVHRDGVVAWELFTQRKLFDQPNDPAMLRAIDELAIRMLASVPRPRAQPLDRRACVRAGRGGRAPR